MKKYQHLKRISSFIIVIAVVITSLPFTALNITAYSRYELYSEIPGESNPVTYLGSLNPVSVWINGGKATHSTGTTSETKSAQISLYEIVNNGYYNITSLKGIEWYVGDSSGKVSIINGKYQTKNANISVSKGKVTAGKEPGTSYVFAYRAAEVKGGEPTFLAVCSVDVKLAPQKVVVYDGVSSDAESAVIKDVSLSLGESTWVYPNAEMSKAIDNIKLDSYSKEFSYSVSIEKNAENISIATAYQNADPGKPISDIPDSEMALGLKITALAITPDTKTTDPRSDDRQDKAAKVNIVITNRQSGKSVKLPVIINNNVIDFTVPDDMNVYTSASFVATPSEINLNPYLSGQTISPSLWGFTNNASYIGSSTVKPLIGVYTTDQSDLFSTYVDSKGKLKLPTKDKSSDITVSVGNKANTKLKVSYKKADYNVPKTLYVVVAYGTDIKNQIKQFKITLLTPSSQQR